MIKETIALMMVFANYANSIKNLNLSVQIPEGSGYYTFNFKFTDGSMNGLTYENSIMIEFSFDSENKDEAVVESDISEIKEEFEVIKNHIETLRK